MTTHKHSKQYNRGHGNAACDAIKMYIYIYIRNCRVHLLCQPWSRSRQPFWNLLVLWQSSPEQSSLAWTLASTRSCKATDTETNQIVNVTHWGDERLFYSTAKIVDLLAVQVWLKIVVSLNELHSISECTLGDLCVYSANFCAKNPPREAPNRWT